MGNPILKTPPQKARFATPPTAPRRRLLTRKEEDDFNKFLDDLIAEDGDDFATFMLGMIAEDESPRSRRQLFREQNNN